MGKNFRRLLIHIALQSFSSTTLSTFGALFVYSISESTLVSLIYYLVHYAALALVRSVGLPYMLKFLNRVGFRKTIIGGLIVRSLMFGLMSLLNPDWHLFSPLLFMVAITDAIGATMYWTPTNTLIFDLIGASTHPGQNTAYASIANTSAAVVASICAILVTTNSVPFPTLLPFVSCLFLVSMVPLMKVNVPKRVRVVSLARCIARISKKSLLANIGGGDGLIHVVLPLIMIATFESFQHSVWVTASTGIAVAVVSFFSGVMKDKRDNRIVFVSFVLGSITWVLYTYASSLLAYIWIGILYALASEVLSTSRDAVLSREVRNSHSSLEATAAVEFSRAIGLVIVIIPTVVSFAVLDELSPWLFLLGIPLIFPKGAYALRNAARIGRRTS